MKNSLLWKLKHPSSGVDHYIYGTMHVRNDAAYSHVSKAVKFLKNTKLYVGEMDLNDPVLVDIQDYFLLPTHTTIIDLYGIHKYTRLRKIILKAFDIDIEEYTDMKPMIIANMIAEKILTAKYDLSLDHYLWKTAVDYNKEMHGLESGQDQIAILKSISLEIQKPMLTQLGKNVNRYRNKVKRLSELYAEENITQLYQSTKKSLGKLRKPLLYTRNHHMADRVVDVTQGPSAFIAIGAAHLGGKFGLLRLLKKSGYTIRPL